MNLSIDSSSSLLLLHHAACLHKAPHLFAGYCNLDSILLFTALSALPIVCVSLSLLLDIIIGKTSRLISTNLIKTLSEGVTSSSSLDVRLMPHRVLWTLSHKVATIVASEALWNIYGATSLLPLSCLLLLLGRLVVNSLFFLRVLCPARSSENIFWVFLPKPRKFVKVRFSMLQKGRLQNRYCVDNQLNYIVSVCRLVSKWIVLIPSSKGKVPMVNGTISKNL